MLMSGRPGRLKLLRKLEGAVLVLSWDGLNSLLKEEDGLNSLLKEEDGLISGLNSTLTFSGGAGKLSWGRLTSGNPRESFRSRSLIGPDTISLI